MSKQRSLLVDGMIEQATTLFRELRHLDTDARVEAINGIRKALRVYSPFASEPVDCVEWVQADEVVSNDWNPNSVAPPEMKLLEHSILEDGYTQPIVTYLSAEDRREVVDGFHRNRVGKECAAVRKRVSGYLPIVTINEGREDRGDRIAATIRHNRARGKHRVEGMSEIVIELKRRNWSDEKIGRELGMDPDEVLRLSQISGLAEMFKDRAFSEAWEAENAETVADQINELDNLDVLEEDSGSEE
jgi:ParB-like chromosome segregation protein Spo0J